MARRRRKKLPEGLFEAEIESLSHDGRGIAHIDGKVIFIEAALPKEKVKFKYQFQRKQFDEGMAVEISNDSPDRVKPICKHADICGGCSLQHMSTSKQLDMKQGVLVEQFKHIAETDIPEILPPLLSQNSAYRRKARLAVKYVTKKSKVLVGFREKRNSFVADIESCEVLHESVGQRLEEISDLIESLQARSTIPQIEFARGDDRSALIFRHLEPLSEVDCSLIKKFCLDYEFDMYLQSGGPSTVTKIELSEVHSELTDSVEGNMSKNRLYFSLPKYDITFAFHPNDFVQVNASLNEKMIDRVMSEMALDASDKVLDLFCGLGNFSLPLASQCGSLVGVEGSEEMVVRATENALSNNVSNCTFFTLDLTQDLADLKQDSASWLNQDFDKLLIDPPRSGALEIVEKIELFSVKKIVYVSCNPATLARDAKVLLDKGYKLKSAGIMDMFPHTNHVESIAVFEK